MTRPVIQNFPFLCFTVDGNVREGQKCRGGLPAYGECMKGLYCDDNDMIPDLPGICKRRNNIIIITSGIFVFMSYRPLIFIFIGADNESTFFFYKKYNIYYV